MKNVSVLIEALPYIRMHKEKLFVIKAGGEVLDSRENMESIAADITLLHMVQIRIVLVHGGGRQATELSSRLGHTPRIINGRRVTDDRALDITKMVYAGKVNVDLLGALRKAGAKAVGLSGVDGDIIHAKRRPVKRIADADTGAVIDVDFGHVGDIVSLNTKLIETLISSGYVPVLASLAADDQGNIYNINADTIASHIAVEMKADKLISLTSAPGVLEDRNDPGSLLPALTASEAARLIENKTVSDGMIPKLETAIAAIEQGVERVHIIDGSLRNGILEEVFTRSGCGTMITATEVSNGTDK